MMTSDEARQILTVYRPGGADDGNPQVREALEQVRRDPELARWFESQRAFDWAVAESVREWAVPTDLKASILASRRQVVRIPAPWWRPIWGDWRVRAAAAAAIVFLMSLAGSYSQRGPTRFADFREVMIEEGWGATSHLQYRSADLIRVKQWLAQNGGPTSFRLPSQFEGHRLHGCSMVNVGGHPVAVLCLAEGPKHLHLFVAEDIQFADLPKDGAPDFQKCGLWKTAAWQNGDRTFVLTGMSYQTFVSTFRKSGRWTMSG